MNNEDLCGFDRPDSPTGGMTCLFTGKTYSELDVFNIGSDNAEQWEPFINEQAYYNWMEKQGRKLPALQA